jgi:flavin reductase (DIM6/NTAB) family NADH-FMN oxidoreductase RutF
MTCTCPDLQHFRNACSRFPTGVTITTVFGDDEEPHGVTLTSFTSLSLQPPLVLICIDHRSQMLKHLERGRYFGINVLSDAQEELSIRFSKNWLDRFPGLNWYRGRTGVPLLFDVSATFECATAEMIPAGDHMIIIGRVLHVSSSEILPLMYVNRSYNKLSRNSNQDFLKAEA